MKTGRPKHLAEKNLSMIIPVLQALPQGMALALGRFAGGMVYSFSRRRRNAYADLKAAFGNQYTPAERWKIVRKNFRHLGQLAVEFVRIPGLKASESLRTVDFPEWDRFKEIVGPRGAIILTAHMGNWEVAQIAIGFRGEPLHVLGSLQQNARVNDWVQEFRISHGASASTRGMGVRGILRALRRKQSVGILGDQDAGKQDGVIVSFFGRKTTLPVGAFDIAFRADVPILHSYIARTGKGKHQITIGTPYRCPVRPDGKPDLKAAADGYVRWLEEVIGRHPEQWLWGSKRWKYSWTKRLVILSDGKPGHVKQSEAIAAKFKSIPSQYGRPGMEYPTRTIEVKFRSPWHRKLFPWFAFIMMPWIQGRLSWLRFFLSKETADQIEEAGADFVISAGSKLVPLNLCLARESCGKSIVLMKPSFPFNLFRYDLAVIGYHDSGLVPQETFRTLLTPSTVEESEMESDDEVFRKSLPDPDNAKLGVFLGGPTKRYTMDLGQIERLVRLLEEIAPAYGDYVITTSRRTPAAISGFLKNKLMAASRCQSLIIANENNQPEVVGGILSVADIVIVTEDSISMISEAVRSGKKVIVLELASRELPVKHRRFKEILERESAVITATLENLWEKVAEARNARPSNVMEKEETALTGKLEQIL